MTTMRLQAARLRMRFEADQQAHVIRMQRLDGAHDDACALYACAYQCQTGLVIKDTHSKPICQDAWSRGGYEDAREGEREKERAFAMLNRAGPLVWQG